MKYILAIICSIILPIFALKPKLCIHCKHFINDNTDSKFGKCALLPNEEININKYFLVNGINENEAKYLNPENYNYCCISRNNPDMCGEEGKFYKKKISNR